MDGFINTAFEVNKTQFQVKTERKIKLKQKLPSDFYLE